MGAMVIHRPHHWILVDLLRCVKEARPSVLVMSLLRFTAGVTLAAPAIGPTAVVRASTAALVLVTAVFFTYLVNGVLDVAEDRLNGSRRPIASGTLSPRFAARVCAATAALSLAGACALGSRTVVATAGILVIGCLYSGPPTYLKRHTVGTGAAGAALGLLAYCAGFAVWEQPVTSLPLLVFATTLAMWMAIVGAPAKDLSDVPGDAAVGRRTLAVAHGEAVTRRLVAGTALLLAAAFVAAAWTVAPSLRWPAAVLAAGALCVVVTCLTRLSRGNRTARRRPYRAFMVTQYLTHVGLLTAVW